MAQNEIPLFPELKIETHPTIVERGDAQRPNRSIRGTFAPTLTTYLPDKNPTGTAVILCPGGGYGSLAVDLHGTEIARWLNERGVAGLILRYRFPRADANLTDDPLPFADARRALQMARDNAAKWNLRPNRIGIMGFSAGGHLAANAGTLFEPSQKPNFLILVSPVISMRDGLTNEGTRNALMGKDRDPDVIKRFSAELNVNAGTPPTFLVHAQNDKVAPLAASELFVEALKQNRVPVTTFLPGDGGHSIDVAVKGDAAQWTQKMEAWMKNRGLMAPTNAPVELTARPLPLADVRLTGGPLKRAQDVDAAYLLSLEPDRMMAYYRIRAGLKPRAEGYGGWDGDGKNLTGHIAGHYLSAVSLMYAATGDVRFKERADTLVREMKEVQAKNGDGSLLALENGREKFAEVARGEIRSSGFDLNGLWAPWYVAHKTFAGLRDAYRLTGNRDALNVEIGFADWAQSVLANLSDAQVQQMLNTEFGGMNEVLAELYADTGDARWLTLSRRFEHHAVIDPLEKGEDKLAGLHANTQVPKLIGSLQRYVVTGDKDDERAAIFFWEEVANHHSFATGGHGRDEYFGPPDELADRLDGRTAESCNVYNMLKMTRELFAIAPDDKYAEFAERALFNHALASLNPETGRSCYMVPVGQGVRHEYQDMAHDFTCCVGTGMENPALYNDGIYYQAKNKLWVNLYAPSTANWREETAKLTMETDFPIGENATLKLELGAPKQFTLMLRRPKWAGNGFSVAINGKNWKNVSAPGSYIELNRTWKSGDRVTLKLPKALHLDATPDNANRAAIMWGPLVLAGDLGPDDDASLRQIRENMPVFVADKRPLTQWLAPVAGRAGAFKSVGVGRPREVELVPFYQLHARTYAIYWDLFTPAQWDVEAAKVAAQRERQKELEAATIGFAQPGEMQPERDFNQQGEDTQPDRVDGRAGRHGKKWFSFDLP